MRSSEVPTIGGPIFIRLDEATGSARELFDAMIELYGLPRR
jgi:hypothetical protein